MNIFNKLFDKIVEKLLLNTKRIKSNNDIYKNINLKQLQKVIGCKIINPNYYYQALTHRSLTTKFLDSEIISNERLEFLGDSILNMVVAKYLYEHFPDIGEGDLTKIRARLVNRKQLAKCAKEIELWNFLAFSPNLNQNFDKGSDSILADGFEAMIAAIFLDRGLDGAEQFINRFILKPKQIESASTLDQNYKSRLLEFVQALGYEPPKYTTANSYGPDHDKIFNVEVIVNNQVAGTGIGKNKKEAEQAAAYNALIALEQLT